VPVISAHALLAITGLGLWGYYLFSDSTRLAWAAVALLAVVATLGLIMASRWIVVYRTHRTPRLAVAAAGVHLAASSNVQPITTQVRGQLWQPGSAPSSDGHSQVFEFQVVGGFHEHDVSWLEPVLDKARCGVPVGGDLNGEGWVRAPGGVGEGLGVLGADGDEHVDSELASQFTDLRVPGRCVRAEFAHFPENSDAPAAFGHGGEGAQCGAHRFGVGVEGVVDDRHAVAAFDDLHAAG
jgi:hypothetical protein